MVIDMFLEPEKTNPFFVLALISICLIGALGTWFSATVILPELTLRTQLGESQQVWLTNAVQLGFVLGAVLLAFFNISDSMSLTVLIALSCTLAALANLLLLWTDTPFGMITLRLMTGAALSGVYPPVVKLIATWFQKGRGIAMGIIIGALTIGSAMPYLYPSDSSRGELGARNLGKLFDYIFSRADISFLYFGGAVCLCPHSV